jgi:HD-like signal output (HDOD) protein
MLTVKQLINDSIKLCTLPKIYSQLNDVINDPNASTSSIAAVIRNDPGMTVRLLRIANSNKHGESSKIDTVSQAVQMLGFNQIQELVRTTTIADVFKGTPKDVMSMEKYWRHSVYCGVVSRLLAHHCKIIESEVLFQAGLLQDIGHLIMYPYLPNYMKHATSKSLTEGISLSEAEEKIIGVNYAQVGGELMRSWNLPDSLYESTLYHLEPGLAENYPLETSIVHIANAFKIEYIKSEGSDATISNSEEDDENLPDLPVDPVAWEITGLTPEIIELVYNEAEEHSNQIFDHISPDAK